MQVMLGLQYYMVIFIGEFQTLTSVPVNSILGIDDTYDWCSNTDLIIPMQILY